jgi:hypothetical protein
MPVSADGARASMLAENTQSTWEIAPSGELTALLLGALTPSGVSWRRVEAPRGARRGAIASDGHAYVYGSDASVLADLSARNVALLRADWTRRDPEITSALAQLGRNGVPVYVFYKKGRAPVVLSELPSASEIRSVLAKP